MEFGLSTHLFASERLTPHILDRTLAAGFRVIEIFAARQHLDYHDPNHVRDVAQWFRDHEVTLHSLHAPLFTDFDWGRSGGLAISISYLERRLRIESMEEIKRALEIADHAPFRFLVLHLGLADEEYDPRKLDAALTSIEHLKIFAKERSVEILLENTPNELSTSERLLQFIQYSRFDDLKVCFDAGHAHMVAGIKPAFEVLKDRVASAHLHDNRGEKDDHLMPFDGDIDWRQALRVFQSADKPFPLLFELRHYGPDVSSLARLREVTARMQSIIRGDS